MAHFNLVEAANEAINRVFDDTLIPKSQTRESLEELRSNIDSLISRMILETLNKAEAADQAKEMRRLAGLADGIIDSAMGIARTAKCRVGEGATKTFALVDKNKLNKLKRRLRKFSPGCLGKE